MRFANFFVKRRKLFFGIKKAGEVLYFHRFFLIFALSSFQRFTGVKRPSDSSESIIRLE